MRGGKRPGAGRPKGPETIAINARIDPVNYAKCVKIAKTNGIPINKVYKEAIKQYVELF